MKTKLAGHLPLQDAIARTITEAREKMKLAAEEKEEKSEKKDEKVKKLLKFEKKEHGHIPSEKEEKEECAEKTSSVIDASDPDEVEKLAAALDEMAEKIADYHELGGESRQGGQTLAVQSPTGGTQPYKKDSSKAHNVPTSTGMIATKDNPGAKTAVPTDDHRAPGGNGAKYPAKGVLKTGGVTALRAVVAAEAEEKTAGKVTDALKSFGGKARAAGGRVAELLKGGKKGEIGEMAGKRAGNSFKGFRQMTGEAAKSTAARAVVAGGAALGAKKALGKKKESSAVDYILGKIATVENGGESRQGGEQLSNTAPVPSNAGRELIRNKDGIKNVTKAQAKSPRKKELAEVLTEPAMSAAHDSKVNENLRNASKGGVKIAAARAFLQKIAEEGCKCEGAGECRHCKMQEKTAALRGNGAETDVSVA